MQAGLDENLNNQFGTIGAAGHMSGGQPFVTEPIPEPGFSPYAAIRNHGTVYAAPALIPTAAVGVNPWDAVFGPIGGAAGTANVPALNTPPQVSGVSFA